MPGKTVLKHEGKIKTFADKQKLRKHIAVKPDLQ